MEKQAVVKPGTTPSELSGRKSEFVKNGKAFAAGEKDEITAAENRLAKHMEDSYTDS